jgi:hypothetical protein
MLTAKEAYEKTIVSAQFNVFNKIKKAIRKGKYSINVSLYKSDAMDIQKELEKLGYCFKIHEIYSLYDGRIIKLNDDEEKEYMRTCTISWKNI